MADTALDIKSLNIQSKEFTSADLFDSLEGETKPIPKKKEVKKKEDEETEENEFDVAGTSLSNIFGDEEETEDEEEENLPTPEKKNEKVEEEQEEVIEEEGEKDEDINTFNSLARELVNMGIFHPEDDEDELEFDGPQAFAERWEYEYKKASRNEISRFLESRGTEATEWFDAVFNKGVSPKEYMQRYDSIEDIVNMNMEDESNQERVVKELLKQQGFEPEDINAELLKLKNIGELEATAQRYHKTLVKRESAKLQELKDKAAQEDSRKKTERENYRVHLAQLLNTKLKNRDFDGIPLTPAVANEAYDSLYNYKYVRPTGEYITQFDKDIEDLQKNPEMKLKVGLLLNILKKDPTMAILKKKAVSKESSELFKDLAQKKKTLIRKQTPIESINQFGV